MRQHDDANFRRVWIPASAGMTLCVFGPFGSTLRHTGEGRCSDALPHRGALIHKNRKHAIRPD
jgi:hypothetical protein